jgi:glutaminyl-tRNA synthetase
MPADGRKVKGTIHWVSTEYAIDADIMMYDKLFTIPNLSEIGENETYNDYLNPDSLKKLTGCKLEPALKDAKPGDKFQFVRMGYFCMDTKNENTFNSIVGLRDSYNK